MQNTGKDSTKPEINGVLSIKRKTMFVTRYVEITNGVLYYYKSKGSNYF